MSKLKAKLDQAIADDLGIPTASDAITLKDLASNPESTTKLIFGYVIDDLVYYDQLPLIRHINGMRIKIPKFQSHPLIEDRLVNSVYKRYYAVYNNQLVPLKVSKVSDLTKHLPFKIIDYPTYNSTLVIPSGVMGLRKKPLMFNRRKVSYVI